eukprot:Gregarina_sp_Poly_1__207@NODE_1049_length_5236_cov_775_534146_g729_i0_p1_GENE_NODE_1049_length_5236_cov_775_534146_g729_i0NODE_1049_length_5236_cov_775_534146_g729_i0_p1_ORF_typecomplete_len404_score45_13_NODE_1049_length_5236_cov_775_534146_g729_i032884499
MNRQSEPIVHPPARWELLTSLFLQPTDRRILAQTCRAFHRHSLSTRAQLDAMGEFFWHSDAMCLANHAAFKKLFSSKNADKFTWSDLLLLFSAIMPEGSFHVSPELLCLGDLVFVREPASNSRFSQSIQFYRCRSHDDLVPLIFYLRNNNKILEDLHRAVSKLKFDDAAFTISRLRFVSVPGGRLHKNICFLDALDIIMGRDSLLTMPGDPNSQLTRAFCERLRNPLPMDSDALLRCTSGAGPVFVPPIRVLQQLWYTSFAPEVEVDEMGFAMFEYTAPSRKVLEEKVDAMFFCFKETALAMQPEIPAPDGEEAHEWHTQGYTLNFQSESKGFQAFFDCDGLPVVRPFSMTEDECPYLCGDDSALGWYAVVTMRHVTACENIQFVIGASRAALVRHNAAPSDF